MVRAWRLRRQGGRFASNVFYINFFSEVANKFYVGYTSDLEARLERHGKDKRKFTGASDDWKLVKSFSFESKTEAIKFESKIKKRGVKRFLEDLRKETVL